MSEKREVECQDCGYRWESSAASPRCSKSECGRSRNVEPVEAESTSTAETADAGDDLGGEHVGDDLDQDEDEESDPAASTEGQESGEDDSGSFRAAFETTSTRSEHVEDDPAAPPSPSTSETDEDDSTESESSTSEDEDEESDPEDDVPELDPEQLAVAFDVSFDMAATRRGDHWELEDGEAEKLGKAWAPVANEYLPSLFAEHTEAGIAIVATTSIVAPRLARDRQLAEQREQREREAANGTPGNVREPEPASTPTEDEATSTDEWPDESTTEQPQTAGGYSNV